MKSRITERNAIAKAKKCYLLHFESSFNPISDNDYNFIVILYFTIVLHAFLKITNILGPKCSVNVKGGMALRNGMRDGLRNGMRNGLRNGLRNEK